MLYYKPWSIDNGMRPEGVSDRSGHLELWYRSLVVMSSTSGEVSSSLSSSAHDTVFRFLMLCRLLNCFCNTEHDSRVKLAREVSKSLWLTKLISIVQLVFFKGKMFRFKVQLTVWIINHWMIIAVLTTDFWQEKFLRSFVGFETFWRET